MKKFRIASIIAIVMSVVSLAVGCAPNGNNVMEYLKDGNFVGSSDKTFVYSASLSVADDMSFKLNIDFAAGGMPDYKADGTGLEYLGCDERDFTSEWLGVQQSNKSYYHVVKLTGATFANGDDVYSFYVVASAQSKNADSFSLYIVRCKNTDNGDADLNAITSAFEKFDVRKTQTNA